MRYSFTEALPKSVISKLAKIWIFYLVLSVIIIYAAGIYLTMQKNVVIINTRSIENAIENREKQIENIRSNYDRLNEEIDLNKLNTEYNNKVRNALSNLFEFIPDQITITQIIMEDKKLTIKGITPSRELYSFLMQAPLRSIFNTSKVDFFPLQNGWFNFTSISESK